MHERRVQRYGDPSRTKNAPPGKGFIALGYHATQVDGVKKFTHVRVAERALGRPLPPGAVVHHADENRLNNDPSNLVICPDRAYHNLLHARMNAMKACGDPSRRPCRHCGQYDELTNLRVYDRGTTQSYWHLQCARDEAKRRYQEKRS